jgi:hypothetical protein
MIATPNQTCTDCGADILAATAQRNNGKCFPCAERKHTYLEAGEQRRFEEYSEKLTLTGWEHSLPHRRNWLDLLERLRVAMRDAPDSAYRALTQYELSFLACTDRRWYSRTIDNLSRMSSRVFAPTQVSNDEHRISFALNGVNYHIHLGLPIEEQRMHLLSVVNQSLAEARISKRFILLPATRVLDPGLSGQEFNPLVFMKPSCIRSAVELELIPDPTGMVARQVQGTNAEQSADA